VAVGSCWVVVVLSCGGGGGVSWECGWLLGFGNLVEDQSDLVEWWGFGVG